MIVVLMFVVLAPSTNPLQGSWFYCADGEYAEMHFRKDYFENCPEYAPYGISYPYKISGDTLVYNIPNKDQEVIFRKFEFISQDSLLLHEDFSGKYSKIILVRIDSEIVMPNSMYGSKPSSEYEEEFNKRKELRSCH